MVTADQFTANTAHAMALLPSADQAAVAMARLGNAMRAAGDQAGAFRAAFDAARLRELRHQAKRKGRPGWRRAR